MIEDAKRASWLELFYDVAFVAIVAQLTYLASAHYQTVGEWLTIFVVAYSIFVAWWGTTANRNLQPTETTQDKLFIQLQMVGMFLMSITMPAVFEGQYVGFFLTLGSMRLLQAFMMARMYYAHPATRPATYNLLEGFFVGGILWVVSAFAVDPFHLVLSMMALSVDVFTPLTQGKGNATRYLNVYHLQERLGLFLMLVIGESMIVVALSSSVARLSVVEPSVVLSGLVLMIALWWLYFEHSDRTAGVRPKSLFIFLQAHGLFFWSLILLSVGYRLVLADPASGAAFLLVVAGAVGIAIAVLLIRLMLHVVCMPSTVKVAALFLLGAAVVFAGFYYDETIITLVSISILFTVAAILDYFGMFRATNVAAAEAPIISA